jgi:type I restriction enzyme S subunit
MRAVWPTLPLRRFLAHVEQGWSPTCENRVAEEHEWGVLKVGCVNGGRFNEQEHKALPGNEEPIPSLEVQKGDILVSRANTRSLVGSAARVGEIVRPHLLLCDKLFRLQIEETRLDPGFLVYALGAAPSRAHLEAGATGASDSMQNIGQDSIRSLPLPVASLSEQRRIVSFLDRNTTVIDEVIAKKERLVSLLAEKRQALITQSVTKGLDANVPMKRSAVEWIGDVPAHWDCRRLKQVSSRIVVGIAQAATHAYSDVGVAIVRSTNVRPNRIALDDLLYIHEKFADEVGAKYVYPGDLLTVRTGNAGVTAVVPASLGRCQCFTMLITTLRQPQSAEFFSFQLNSDVGVVYFGLEGWGSAQANISVPILQNTPVAVPPVDEQRTIVEYLEKESGRLETASGAIQRQIDRVREYRQALITAAVTGKLDVDSVGAQTDDAVEQLAEGP